MGYTQPGSLLSAQFLRTLEKEWSLVCGLRSKKTPILDLRRPGRPCLKGFDFIPKKADIFQKEVDVWWAKIPLRKELVAVVQDESGKCSNDTDDGGKTDGEGLEHAQVSSLGNKEIWKSY